MTKFQFRRSGKFRSLKLILIVVIRYLNHKFYITYLKDKPFPLIAHFISFHFVSPTIFDF